MTSLFAIFCFGLAITGIVLLGLKNASDINLREKVRTRRAWKTRMQQPSLPDNVRQAEV
jgi:hypothetical protein